MTNDPLYLTNRIAPRLTREEERRAWKKMKRGDIAARQLLLESVVPWILRVSTKYAPADRQRFEELVAIGMAHMAAAVLKFDPDRGRLTTFTARCLHFLYVKERAKPQRYVPMGLLEDVRDRRAPEALHNSSHCVAAVQAVISALPTREREIVTRRLQGQTLREIGDFLGVTKERVRQIEMRAHDYLRVHLAYDPVVREFLT